MIGCQITLARLVDSRYPLFSLYLDHFEEVADLYDLSPHDRTSYDRRVAELRDFDGNRGALAGALEAYNRMLGGPPESLAAARLLAEPGSVAVVGGQQPGVLTGPLYTFWKALTVLQLARAVKGLGLGVPVVPVFWMGAEDHDLAEVAAVPVLTPGGEIVRVVYSPGEVAPGQAYPARTSVGYLPAGPAAQTFLDALEPVLWPTEFRDGIMGTLRQTADASLNLADWFGRLLLTLLGREGLVVANPLLPGLRALQSRIFRRMITENGAIADAFRRGQDRVHALGLEPQVEKDPAAANLYLYRGQERVPLYRVDGPTATSNGADGIGAAYDAERSRAAGSWFQAGDERLSEEELLAVAAAAPERLSPNVILRPVAQDALFPVLAYVGGPGETSYYGLYREVFHCLGRRMPVVYPRPGVTLVEPAVARNLERCGLSVEEALDPETVRRARAGYVEETDPVGIDQLFDGLTATVRRAYDDLLPILTGLDPSLAGLTEKNRDRVIGQANWLRKKAWRQHRRNCSDAVRRFKSLEAALRPRGYYQERVYNLFPSLVKFGPDLVARLTRLPIVPSDATVDPSHRFVWL